MVASLIGGTFALLGSVNSAYAASSASTVERAHQFDHRPRPVRHRPGHRDRRRYERQPLRHRDLLPVRTDRYSDRLHLDLRSGGCGGESSPPDPTTPPPPPRRRSLPSATGYWCFAAAYSGDSNYSASSDDDHGRMLRRHQRHLVDLLGSDQLDHHPGRRQHRRSDRDRQRRRWQPHRHRELLRVRADHHAHRLHLDHRPGGQPGRCQPPAPTTPPPPPRPRSPPRPPATGASAPPTPAIPTTAPAPTTPPTSAST